MADFLCCLFNISADPYKQFNFPSKKVLEPYQIKGDKPYFGRKSVSSNFLTVQGLKTMEKILFFLQAKFSDISYCPMLPRIVQMLLWYVPEKIALKIVLNLIEETENPSSSDSKQFIITSPLKAKALIRKSLSQVKGEFHKRNARKIVGEAIDELLTTIVPAEVISKSVPPTSVFRVSNIWARVYFWTRRGFI